MNNNKNMNKNKNKNNSKEQWLVEGGGTFVGGRAPKWHNPCWQHVNGREWMILVGDESRIYRVLEKG